MRDVRKICLTCEHGGHLFGGEHCLQGEDRRLVGTHWTYDLGARELTLELGEKLGASLAIANFSRLLIDANRDLHEDSLIRSHADGSVIALNQALSAHAREARIRSLWQPFHAGAARVACRASQVLLSVHSFTPIYEGRVRAVEVGVLHDNEEVLALALMRHLRAEGFRVHENEPYSGKDGLIYSPARHARASGTAALELEVRQDLAVRSAIRCRIVRAVERFVAEL